MLSLLLLTTVPTGFGPLAPLVGHCWRGTLPNGGVDTHCFTRDGAAVIDRHVVEQDARPVYHGETRYTLEDGRLRWAYRNAGGPVMAGGLTRTGSGLRFTVDGGPPLTWRWRGKRAYEASTGPKAEPVLFRRVQ